MPLRCGGGSASAERRMASGPLSSGSWAGGGGGPRAGCRRLWWVGHGAMSVGAWYAAGTTALWNDGGFVRCACLLHAASNPTNLGGVCS